MKLEVDVSEITNFFQNLGDEALFDEAMQSAVRKIGKEMKKMLIDNTPYKTGKLQKGWKYSHYIIKDEGDGYSVTLTNKVDYARAVNYGHYSRNQFNPTSSGKPPYVVKNRTVPYTQGNNADTFVFGHFFVEKSMLQLRDSKVIERILRKELVKWFKRCANGK